MKEQKLENLSVSYKIFQSRVLFIIRTLLQRPTTTVKDKYPQLLTPACHYHHQPSL